MCEMGHSQLEECCIQYNMYIQMWHNPHTNLFPGPTMDIIDVKWLFFFFLLKKIIIIIIYIYFIAFNFMLQLTKFVKNKY
jgi:hypothetical protein